MSQSQGIKASENAVAPESHNSPVRTSAKVERFERVNDDDWIQAGLYVRSREDENAKVVMIDSLNWAEGQLHSVCVRVHPTAGKFTSKLTLEDFINTYAPEPRGQAIREAEIEDVQNEMRALQSNITKGPPQEDMAQLEHNPEQTGNQKHNAGSLVIQSSAYQGASPTVGGMIANADFITDMEKRAQFQLDTVSQKQDWIADQVHHMNGQVKLLGRYMEERAVAMRGIFAESKREIDALLKSLTNFSLYTGENVDLEHIIKGAPSGDSEQLVVYQQKLYMDEECLVNAIDQGLEADDFDLFEDELKADKSLLERILPAPKCVVLMGYSRQWRDRYEDMHGLVSRNVMERNDHGFLLIRNGENVYRMFADVMVKDASTLFPVTGAGENHFKGEDGRTLTMADLAYDTRSSDYEHRKLQFRRVLIALWGLNDREAIFGKQWCQHPLHFGSQKFQDKYFEFRRDAESSGLLHEGRPSWGDWLKTHNTQLASGSRIVARPDNLITEATASGCFSRHQYHERHREWYAINSESILTVSRVGADLFVTVPVKQSWQPDKTKNTPVKISATSAHLMCLDRVTSDDLAYYLNSRVERKSYLKFIPLFQLALKVLREEEEWQGPFVDQLKVALSKCGVRADDAIVLEAVSRWRIVRHGKPLPRPQQTAYKQALTSLVKTIKTELTTGQAFQTSVAEAFEDGIGEKLIRMSRSSNGAIMLYSLTPKKEQGCVPRVYPWVKKYSVTRKSAPFTFATRTPLLMSSVSSHETVLWQDDKAVEAQLIGAPIAGLGYNAEVALLGSLSDTRWARTFLLGDLSATALSWEKLARMYRRSATAGGGEYVLPCYVKVPVGMRYVQRGRGAGEWVAITLQCQAEDWLYHFASDDNGSLMKALLNRVYGSTEVIDNKLTALSKQERPQWALSMSGAVRELVQFDDWDLDYGRIGNRCVSAEPLKEAIAANIVNSSMYRRSKEAIQKSFMDELGNIVIFNEDLIGEWSKFMKFGPVELSFDDD